MAGLGVDVAPITGDVVGAGLESIGNTIIAKRKEERERNEKRAKFLLDQSIAMAHQAAAAGELAVQHKQHNLAQQKFDEEHAAGQEKTIADIWKAAGGNPQRARAIAAAAGIDIQDIASDQPATMPQPSSMQQAPGPMSGQASPEVAPTQETVPPRPPAGPPQPEAYRLGIDNPEALGPLSPRTQDGPHPGMVLVDHEEGGQASLQGQGDQDPFIYPLPPGAREGDWIPDPRLQQKGGIPGGGDVANALMGVRANARRAIQGKKPRLMFNLGEIGDVAPPQADSNADPLSELPPSGSFGRTASDWAMENAQQLAAAHSDPTAASVRNVPSQKIEASTETAPIPHGEPGGAFKVKGPHGNWIIVDPAASKAEQEKELQDAIKLKAAGPEATAMAALLRQKERLDATSAENEKYRATNPMKDEFIDRAGQWRVRAAQAGGMGMTTPKARGGMAELFQMLNDATDENGNVDQSVWPQISTRANQLGIPATGNKGNNWTSALFGTVKTEGAAGRTGRANAGLEATDAEGNVIGKYKSSTDAREGSKAEASFARARDRVKDLVDDIQRNGSRVLSPAEAQLRISKATAAQAALRVANQLGSTDYSQRLEEQINGAMGAPGHGWLLGANPDVLKNVLADAERYHTGQQHVRLQHGGIRNPLVNAARGQGAPTPHPAQESVGATRPIGGKTYRKVGKNNWQEVAQ